MSKLIILQTLFVLVGSYFVSNSPMNGDYQLVSVIFIFLLFLPIIISLSKWLGYLKASIALLSLGLFALIFEAQAIITGWPYGEFIYHQQIGAKVLGIVPWTVPFAWLPLLIGGLVIGYRLHTNPYVRVIVSSLIMIWADLIIDPGAVGLGFWSYSPSIF
jgi:putative membrane protein